MGPAIFLRGGRAYLSTNHDAAEPVSVYAFGSSVEMLRAAKRQCLAGLLSAVNDEFLARLRAALGGE